MISQTVYFRPERDYECWSGDDSGDKWCAHIYCQDDLDGNNQERTWSDLNSFPLHVSQVIRLTIVGNSRAMAPPARFARSPASH